MSKPTILIVDDERSARDGMALLFKDDYNVLSAESGSTALKLLDLNSIDVMLSDVRMPGMDGLELLEKAQKKQPSLSSIILTAYGDVDLAVKAMKIGAVDFMTKPLNIDKLELILKRLLKTKNLRFMI